MTDAFNVAFRIPNLLRRLFAEGAFSQAFVPILGEVNAKNGENATHQLINVVATLLFWSLLIAVAIGVIFAPTFVLLIASGFKSSETYSISVVLTRMMFPYIGFISMVSLAAGILNTYKKFMIPAFTPVLLNLGMIVGSLYISKFFQTPIYGLGIGVMIGGILQLAIQIPSLLRIGMLPRIGLGVQSIRTAIANPEARRILKLMGPAIFAVSVSQLSLIINTNIASHLQAGSVSWLSYADRLMEFPTALLGVAVGTVLLPSLSKANTTGNHEQAKNLIHWGIRLTFILAAPAAMALFLFGTPLAASLYNYGKFSAHDVEMTRLALQAYGVGLIGLILIKILAPGFYAKQDIRTPVKIGLVVLIFTQLMNLLFVPRFAHAGLALSIGLGACLNAALLWIGLSRRGAMMAHGNQGWGKFFLRLLVALSVLGGILYFGSHQYDWVELGKTPLLRIFLMLAWVSGAMFVYLVTLKIGGFNFRELLKHAH
jgi:putative peptidoglycan lipid II flippase